MVVVEDFPTDLRDVKQKKREEKSESGRRGLFARKRLHMTRSNGREAEVIQCTCRMRIDRRSSETESGTGMQRRVTF